MRLVNEEQRGQLTAEQLDADSPQAIVSAGKRCVSSIVMRAEQQQQCGTRAGALRFVKVELECNSSDCLDRLHVHSRLSMFWGADVCLAWQPEGCDARAGESCCQVTQRRCWTCPS